MCVYIYIYIHTHPKCIHHIYIQTYECVRVSCMWLIKLYNMTVLSCIASSWYHYVSLLHVIATYWFVLQHQLIITYDLSHRGRTSTCNTGVCERAASAAGLHGQGSPKRSVSFTDTGSTSDSTSTGICLLVLVPVLCSGWYWGTIHHSLLVPNFYTTPSNHPPV